MLFHPRPTVASDVLARVRAWVIDAARLDADAPVLVTQLTCTELGCAPLETVVALVDGRPIPARATIHRAMADVTQDDVLRAVGDWAHGSTTTG